MKNRKMHMWNFMFWLQNMKTLDKNKQKGKKNCQKQKQKGKYVKK